MKTSSRRKLLSGIAIATVSGLAGCGGSSGGGSPSSTTRQKQCTAVHVSDIESQSHLFGDNEYSATLVNQGDIAGTVTLELAWYPTESSNAPSGTTTQRVSIGAQATKDVTIKASPPTDDSDYYNMQIRSQDCKYE